MSPVGLFASITLISLRLSNDSPTFPNRSDLKSPSNTKPAKGLPASGGRIRGGVAAFLSQQQGAPPLTLYTYYHVCDVFSSADALHLGAI